MGLMNRIFGGAAKDHGPSSQFSESQTAVGQTKSRNAPRRDLVHVTLRETMRKHGIPSDWIECRTLSVLTRQHKQGMHVQFLVRKADHQLLAYVHAFQESFWHAIQRSDPRAKDWLFSVGWEFYGKSVQEFGAMPDPGSWKDPGAEASRDDLLDTQPPEDNPDELESDLQALQAVMSAPADLSNLPEAKPRTHRPG
jgi:hypothetical protein